MDTNQTRLATAAALACAADVGLEATDAIVLQNSNRVVLRLLPCDAVVRIAPLSFVASAEFEIAIARRLAGPGSAAAELDPRVDPKVYLRDGFALNFWTYYEPAPPLEIGPAEYAEALERLHAGMRTVDLDSPHFTDRVAEAQQLVANREETPELEDADRALLERTLRTLRARIVDRGRPEQLLHGEPHPGNLLRTASGLRFIDFETCCRGPVEFDIAHAPDEVGEHYPGADQELLRECRVLILAMVAAWRWDRGDQFPGGRRMGLDYIALIRQALQRDDPGIAP